MKLLDGHTILKGGVNVYYDRDFIITYLDHKIKFIVYMPDYAVKRKDVIKLCKLLGVDCVRKFEYDSITITFKVVCEEKLTNFINSMRELKNQ